MNSNSYVAAVPAWPESPVVDMFDLLSTGALVLDDAFALQRINPAAQALLDVSERQAVGEPLERLLPAASDFHAAVQRCREVAAPLSEREVVVGGPSGRHLTVDLTVTPLVGPGEPGGFLVEFFPVDRHLRISREEYLVAQNEVARNVVRSLAHEIRNPLGGIRGAAQLLQHELPAPDLREYTSVIIDEADRLQRLVDQLLGPRSRPAPRQINVHEVTERVAALICAEAQPGVKVTKDYDPSIPPLEADPELLIQALLNVARNAVHAVAGNGQVSLRTRIDRHRTIGTRTLRLAARIDVVDDGPGVPDELKDTLFYPMVTGRCDGAGLGLSIAQTLVTQHGGIIELADTLTGSVFSIILPVELES
jgi:two-component system, NtrC family, nitrogen regulation sensor histidine kinase GlnL